VDKILGRITREGEIADMPSLTIATRSRPESYEQVVRMTLQHQEKLALTSVAQGIPVLTALVASMLRSGEATCASTQTCLDHAKPGQPRLPRLSVEVTRTAALQLKLMEQEIENGRKAEADVIKRKAYTGADGEEGVDGGDGKADAEADGDPQGTDGEAADPGAVEEDPAGGAAAAGGGK